MEKSELRRLEIIPARNGPENGLREQEHEETEFENKNVTAIQRSAPGPFEPGVFRKSCRDLLLGSLSELLDAILTRAIEGSLQHAKEFVAWSGVLDESATEDERTSLALLLIEQLRKDQAEERAEERQALPDPRSAAKSILRNGHPEL